MIANLVDKPMKLFKGQRVATTDLHPLRITESTFTHAEIFGINENEHYMYKKRILSARDTTLTETYLVDSRNSSMNEEEKSMTADNINLNDDNKIFHQRIRDMLRKHENMRNGLLGHINVAEHAIDLKDGAK